MTMLLFTTAALALEWMLGEPRRFHPLLGFGRLASMCERCCYGHSDLPPVRAS